MIFVKYQIKLLKALSGTFLPVCFLSLKESFCETRKNDFVLLQKLFLFWRKSKFIQISQCHQMPKHKIQNTFHWITLEVNTFCLWNLASSCYITKFFFFFKKSYKNCNLKTSCRPFCVCKELRTTSIGKCHFWRNLLMLDM